MAAINVASSETGTAVVVIVEILDYPPQLRYNAHVTAGLPAT